MAKLDDRSFEEQNDRALWVYIVEEATCPKSIPKAKITLRKYSIWLAKYSMRTRRSGWHASL
jgi:hypothetical protein